MNRLESLRTIITPVVEQEISLSRLFSKGLTILTYGALVVAFAYAGYLVMKKAGKISNLFPKKAPLGDQSVKSTEELLEMIERRVLAPEPEFLTYLVECADNVLNKPKLIEGVELHPVTLQLAKMRTEIKHRLSRRPMK